jgi:hypothetical protein
LANETGLIPLVAVSSERWTIEPSFRDTKDLRFGMGLAQLRIGDPMRRDRLLFLNALAVKLLTLLGAAGESLGMDRDLRTSTVSRRSYSLFRPGYMWFGLIPNMPEPRLKPLLARFDEMINQNKLLFNALTGVEK